MPNEDDFDELVIGNVEQAITFMETYIEMEATEIQLVKNENDAGFVGRYKLAQ